jgi:prepilin-type N-terminal cleavage/methylation domain-containing protein
MWIFSRRSIYFGNKGFTLIELLVVISIMLVITSTLLLQQKKFDSSTLMRSLAYSIALSVRQAQLYGTSLRENAPGAFTAGTAANAYGIYLDNTTTGSSVSPNYYILFADQPTTGTVGQYDSTEKIQQFNLSAGYYIADFCAIVSGTPNCKSAGQITKLNIYFKRPNTDAQFTVLNGSTPVAGVSQVYLQLTAPNGDFRNILITGSGQISVCGLNIAYASGC